MSILSIQNRQKIVYSQDLKKATTCNINF